MREGSEMKKARYSEEQIVRILREADRDPVAEVAKRHGVSEQSIYGWRNAEAVSMVLHTEIAADLQ